MHLEGIVKRSCCAVYPPLNLHCVIHYLHWNMDILQDKSRILLLSMRYVIWSKYHGHKFLKWPFSSVFMVFIWTCFLTCFFVLNNMCILSNIASSLTKVFNAMTLERPILKCCLEKWSWYSNNFSMHESPKSKIL